MKPAALPCLALLLLPLAAAAQDPCTAKYSAEQDRITREFTAQAPPRGDPAAAQAWSKRLHDALAASAQRAEDCTRANRKPPAPAAVAAEQDCMAGVTRRLDEVNKRYGARTLSREEQAARRAEEDRLLDERMQCSRPARR